MADRLIAKLENFTRLSAEDKHALDQAASLKVRHLAARDDLAQEGDRPRHVNLILEGWACRYKHLEDGRRSVTVFLLPGDMCDMRMFILRAMDHSIMAVSPLKVAEIPGSAIQSLTDTFPRIGRALWWTTLVEEAIQREWTTSLGQRDAQERLAHLFCELLLRLRAVGLTRGEPDQPSFDLPLTQEILGDAVGLSTVHVNRTLQAMREQGLIVLRGKTLTVPDPEALQTAGLFNPNYLHLDREGRAFDANE